MNKRSLHVIFLLLLGGVFVVHAGRPVFHDMSLEELIGQSNAIVVVRKSDPFEVKGKKISEDCQELKWRFKIVEILYQGSRSPSGGPPLKNEESKTLKVGEEIEVLHNALEIQDCLNRLQNESGYSFSANRYKSSDPTAINREKELILFVIVHKDSTELTVEQAYEPISSKDKILRLLK